LIFFNELIDKNRVVDKKYYNSPGRMTKNINIHYE